MERSERNALTWCALVAVAVATCLGLSDESRTASTSTASDARPSACTVHAQFVPTFPKGMASSSLRGFDVVLRERRGDSIRVLEEGTLDEAGRVSFRLPWLAKASPLERATARIEVVPDDPRMVLAPLHQSPAVHAPERARFPVFLDDPGDAIRELRVPVHAGPLARGVVLLPGGEPAAYTHLKARLREPPGVVQELCTDEQGQFAFRVTHTGEWIFVFFGTTGIVAETRHHLEGHASSVLTPFRIEPNAPLRLESRWPDGTSAPGGPFSLDWNHGGTPVPGPRLTCAKPTHVHGWGTSDATGRVQLSVFPDFYARRSGPPTMPYRGGVGALWFGVSPHHQGLDAWSLLSLSLERDQVNVVTVRAHALRFRVTTRSGRPVYQARFRLERLRGKSRKKHLECWSDEHGRCVAWVPHGTVWRADTWAPGARTRRLIVRAREGVNETHLGLQLRSLHARGQDD